jgi:hypothetical protein
MFNIKKKKIDSIEFCSLFLYTDNVTEESSNLF